ncbi:MAG: DUF2330 domain-containing protein [Ktedonobacterales bacterium]
MRVSFPRLLKRLVPATVLAWLLATQAMTALACGGLVAPNGAVRLSRAATLVAWHDGVEHYLTSFSYQGDVSKLGWIVPLPAVPVSIQEGGAWTLQRLFRETHPIPTNEATAGFANAAASAPVQVIEQVKIEALNITVLKGSGQAVLDWCTQNGFDISGDTRGHLLAYAVGSPIFMAAKYDTAAARARHQTTGDGAPVLITMKVPHPWVPLEVLALDGQQVHADLYFLTDQPLNTSAIGAHLGQTAVGTQIGGASGFTVAFQEAMNPSLYHDLSTDRNMSWVRPDGWLTYASLDAPNTSVNYDLSIGSDGVFHLAPFGTAPMSIVSAHTGGLPAWLPMLPPGAPQFVLKLWLALVILGLTIGLFVLAARRSAPARPAERRRVS